MTALPDIQLALRPGIVEMRWGNPDPALLPEDIARAADLALRREGRERWRKGRSRGRGVAGAARRMARGAGRASDFSR